jgi:hypothetical protein
MKVIDGKFGRKEADEQALLDKLAYAASEMVASHEDKGRFILMTESEEGLAQIATDMSLPEVFLLFEVIKHSLLTNPEQTTIH